MTTVQKIAALRKLAALLKKQNARIADAQSKIQKLLATKVKLDRSIKGADRALYSEQLKKYVAR